MWCFGAEEAPAKPAGDTVRSVLRRDDSRVASLEAGGCARALLDLGTGILHSAGEQATEDDGLFHKTTAFAAGARCATSLLFREAQVGEVGDGSGAYPEADLSGCDGLFEVVDDE